MNKPICKKAKFLKREFKLLPVLLCLITLQTSCRKLVTNDFPYYEPVPVINSLLFADSTIWVHVSLSSEIDSTQLIGVEQAEVLLFIDDTLAESLPHVYSGYYESKYLVSPDHKYGFEVRIPGHESAFGSTYIPPPTSISIINHTTMAGKDEEGYPYSSMTFRISDDPDAMNHYEIEISDGGYLVEYLPVTDPVLLNTGLPLPIFNDELINSDTCAIAINYRNEKARYEGEVLSPVVFELRSLSASYYQYLIQAYLYKTGRYPDLVGGVLSVFQQYSNVEGGLGIVAGYCSVLSDTIVPDQIDYLK